VTARAHAGDEVPRARLDARLRIGIARALGQERVDGLGLVGEVGRADRRAQRIGEGGTRAKIMR
jgi:hypothetical protein